jgi:hypothetical protein
MAEPEQVSSSGDVDFGKQFTLNWLSNTGTLSVVPPGKVLVIGSLTLNYFPAGGGTIGRLDVRGNMPSHAAWMLQIVYVEPKKTLHLTFPQGLKLEAGGVVQLSFTSEGPGNIHVCGNALLLPA